VILHQQNKKVDKTENLVDYHGEFGGLSRRIWWIITENLVDYHGEFGGL
jgi:hypothetical protein